MKQHLLPYMAGRLHGLLNPLHPSLLILPLYLLCTVGCRHVVREDVKPAISTTPSYSMERAMEEEKLQARWWLSFDDQLLSNYIQQSLDENLSLREGYSRLKQAQLSSSQAYSRRYPALDGGIGLDSSWQENGEQRSSERAEVKLAWEVDLWGKLSSASQSADFEALAAGDELQGMALRLSTEVAETYYRLIEESLLRALLKEQVTANETSLNLIKLRFANGAASLVDVYQQEELLVSVKAQLPLSEARLITLYNSFHLLLGQAPNSTPLPLGNSLPDIPSFPDIGVPADLLLDRPDLRQMQRELVAADYRVAKAVAERLPTIKVGSSAALVSGDLLFSLFADALATIFDWGYKKNEVEKQRAMVEEKLASYSQRYLLAIKEVEDSLWQERQHDQLLATLDRQLQIAKATLHESRNRYIQGVTDYLPVLAALVSRQNLERNILQRRRERLSYRLLLYRALGTSLLNLEPHSAGSKS
ncbi:MAG: TolC family protein [Thermodesulfobacteriota bacterium]